MIHPLLVATLEEAWAEIEAAGVQVQESGKDTAIDEAGILNDRVARREVSPRIDREPSELCVEHAGFKGPVSEYPRYLRSRYIERLLDLAEKLIGIGSWLVKVGALVALIHQLRKLGGFGY